MRAYFLALVTGILMGISAVQAQTFQWVKTTGSPNSSDYLKPRTVRTDNGGNSIVVGNFTGTFDFNPGPSVTPWSTASLTATDVYIQKFDPSGNLLWTAAFQGNGNISAQGLFIDASGNVYVSGSFDTPVDFNSAPGVTLTSPLGFQDGYVCKLNNNGVFQWVKTWGDSQSLGDVNASKVSGIGNDLVVAGNFGSTIDFNPGPGITNLSATGFADIFLLRLTANGDFVWAKSMSGTDFADVYGLATDASNNIWISGDMVGTIDFDPSPAVNSLSTVQFNTALFAAKYSSTGNYIWAGAIAGDAGLLGNRSLAIDANGDAYLACIFTDTLDANPGPATNLFVSAGLADALIIKLNSAGVYQWAAQMGGTGEEQLMDLAITNNRIIATGYFDGTADMDPGASTYNINSNGDYDAFYVALQTNGQFLQAKQFGSANPDGGFSIAPTNNNELYIVGLFANTVDFNPGPGVANATAQSPQESDQFLLKWGTCAVIPVNNITAYDCNSYTLNGQTYTATGVYTQVYQSLVACDSLVVLNLNIGNNNVTINHVQCGANSYTFNGQTYSAPGTYTQFYTNQANCDSNITLVLSFGNASASTINATACDFYFLGNDIYFTSGTYTQIIPNATGCDSVITLNLTINNSVYNYQSIQSCGPYVYNGQSISQPGYYSFFYTSANGCDSVEEFDLFIEYPQLINQNLTACQQHFFNGQWLTTSGIYNAVYLGANGCDSTISLNLTVISPNVTVNQNGAVLSAVANAQATYQWLNCTTNQPIPGANQATYTASANGSYAVIVTVNGCADTSLCRTVSGLSTQNIVNDKLANVYPNPASNEVTISWTNTQVPTDLRIHNMAGQLMYQTGGITENKHRVDINNWAAGIYFITLEQDGRRQIMKLTKN